MRLIRNDLQDLALFSEASRSELAVIGRQLTRLNITAGTRSSCARAAGATSS